MWLMQLQGPQFKTARIYEFQIQEIPATNLPTWKNISKDN